MVTIVNDMAVINSDPLSSIDIHGPWKIEPAISPLPRHAPCTVAVSAVSVAEETSQARPAEGVRCFRWGNGWFDPPKKLGFHGISWDLRSKNWGFMGFNYS